MNELIYQVDAFTNKPFRGNPAGVVLLNKEQSDKWMLSFAREMNLSETAFVIGEKSSYNLRWFTPAVEVELCGHATLATAHILYEKENVESLCKQILAFSLNADLLFMDDNSPDGTGRILDRLSEELYPVSVPEFFQ